MAAKRRNPEAEDDRYLKLRRAGVGYRDIARLVGRSYRTVWLGVARARERERRPPPPQPPPPRLAIMFGSSCKPLRLLKCEDVHHGPIPDGSVCLCAVCHGSGLDDHPGLRRDRESEPKPDPKPRSKPKPKAKR